MKYEPPINDSNMLKFIEQKIGIPQTYPIEITDEIPFFRYLYEQLKEVWYGLSVINFHKDPNPDVDNLILKHKDHWLMQVFDSIAFSEKHKNDEDWQKYSNPIRYIGVLHL
jgi:hypothetical protein